ncbi:hypothetical protein FJTKL_03875 [Diaporthe vaccinii]|uniref:Uncharacterized protein n=1 Tax=Diaporthe vaccinii TaxID=105482 RepID=A0ABR4F1C9_9PEZI
MPLELLLCTSSSWPKTQASPLNRTQNKIKSRREPPSQLRNTQKGGRGPRARPPGDSTPSGDVVRINSQLVIERSAVSCRPQLPRELSSTVARVTATRKAVVCIGGGDADGGRRWQTGSRLLSDSVCRCTCRAGGDVSLIGIYILTT